MTRSGLTSSTSTSMRCARTANLPAPRYGMPCADKGLGCRASLLLPTPVKPGWRTASTCWSASRLYNLEFDAFDLRFGAIAAIDRDPEEESLVRLPRLLLPVSSVPGRLAPAVDEQVTRFRACIIDEFQ